MRYHEKLNIVFMRDNGPRHSIRIRRSRFYILIAFFISLPFVCILLAVQCWLLWQNNIKLGERADRFELDYKTAINRAERLENLENLLKEENVASREIIIKELAGKNETEPEVQEDQQKTQQLLMEEGPGHEDFPAVDKGRIKVENVQARIMRGNALMVNMDLRNPEKENSVSGNVDVYLVTAGGIKSKLNFDPEDAGKFRINRYKRSVMRSQIPLNTNLVNSSIILEVRDNDNKLIFQNIYNVQGQ